MPLKRLAYCVLVVWFAFLGMHGYYALLDFWNTPHPSYLPLLTFIAVQVVALFLSIAVGVWQLIRRPQRFRTLAWLSLGLLPAFLWYSHVSLSFHFLEDRATRQTEIRWNFITTLPMTAAIFDGVGRWTLPNRLEGDRVVMFYDSSVTDPKSDLETMDDFIKKEEAYLGVSMSTKIHWMRASILGMRGVATVGVAVAMPEESRDGTKRIGAIDFHEAAHNVSPNPSGHSVYAGRYPPNFLVEGWAMARSEEWETLAEQCWQFRKSQRALTVRDAVSDVYYNQTGDRIYRQGGAFVTVLLDKFGPEKFRELYTHCTRKTFEQDVRRIYSLTLEELDTLYWQEIDSHRAMKRSYEKATEHCSPEEKALLDEFREACQRQIDAYYRLTDNGTLKAMVRHSYHSSDTDLEAQDDLLFQARDGQFARFYNKYAGTRITIKNDVKTEISAERIDCHLLTPDESISMFQHSGNEGVSSQQNTWRTDVAPQEREYRQQHFRQFYLTAFYPFSLFHTGYGHAFSYPDDYLWEPPIGTVIQSVVVDGDDVILTLTPWERHTVTLRMDRQRDWLLLEAKNRETVDGSIVEEEIDVREYGDVPLLKKRSVSRIGHDGRLTHEMELVRFDPAAADEAVFSEDNLPVNIPKPKVRIPVEQRMKRHWLIAGCWLFVPLLVTLWPTQKKQQRFQA